MVVICYTTYNANKVLSLVCNLIFCAHFYFLCARARVQVRENTGLSTYFQHTDISSTYDVFINNYDLPQGLAHKAIPTWRPFAKRSCRKFGLTRYLLTSRYQELGLTLLKERTTTNNEMKRVQTELVVASLKAVPRHSPGRELAECVI